MTAPLPPDPATVLARLEELHKAGTADGPWRAVDNHGQFDPEYRFEILDDEGTVAVCTGDNDGATATTGADRSALIEAAVNSLPALLAAVRGVLAEHKPYTRDVAWNSAETICGTCRYDDGLDAYVWPCPTVAAIAAALEGAR